MAIENAWAELDACATADAIRDWLVRHAAVGKQYVEDGCPLARATGYFVGAGVSWDASAGHETLRDLTLAEQTFVKLFDDGNYPELIEEKHG